jgi:predicted phage terminase large subunit-like protein
MLTAEVVEGFVGSVLAKRFDQPAPIPPCHREWWELCTSKHPFVAIAAPRGFAKSTAITHSYTLACVLFRERSFVLLISGTEAQAILFLNDIKSELKDNTAIHQLFGTPRFLKDAETDIIVELSDGHKFRIIAKGSEQSLRGAKWLNRRPDLLICDDIEEDEQVMNKDRRDKFRRWFFGALIPCRSDNGIIRVVGTILHMDSMLERLMPEFQLQSKRKHLFLKIEPLKTWTEQSTGWRSVKYRAHDDAFEHLLWPEKKSEKELRSIRANYMAQGLPEVYSQEYLNIPIDDSVAYFKKGEFVDRTLDDQKKSLRFYIASDLAISEKDRADWSAFVIGGLDENGLLHIVNVIRERMDAREIVETIFALEKHYKPEVFAVEKGQIEKAIGPFLNEEMPKRNIWPQILPLSPSVDKWNRARSIQGRMRARAVRFDKDADWYQDFESELTRFPRDKHDDQVDAFAYLGLILDRMVEAPTEQEIADDIYYDAYEQSGLLELGRNSTTGY